MCLGDYKTGLRWANRFLQDSRKPHFRFVIAGVVLMLDMVMGILLRANQFAMLAAQMDAIETNCVSCPTLDLVKNKYKKHLIEDIQRRQIEDTRASVPLHSLQPISSRRARPHPRLSATGRGNVGHVTAAATSSRSAASQQAGGFFTPKRARVATCLLPCIFAVARSCRLAFIAIQPVELRSAFLHPGLLAIVHHQV
jgi:hypothetical protein